MNDFTDQPIYSLPPEELEKARKRMAELEIERSGARRAAGCLALILAVITGAIIGALIMVVL